jgi:hypothetical protein
MDRAPASTTLKEWSHFADAEMVFEAAVLIESAG